MSFRLRRMTPEDLDAVLALAHACPEAPHWPPSAYRPFAEPASSAAFRRTAVVAVPEVSANLSPAPPAPGLLGFAFSSLLLAGPSADPSGPPEESRCELESIAVHPDHRRHGIGAALLRAVLAWAAENGASSLLLEVRASNTSAIALYQSLGLVLQGRRPRYYIDPEEDALLLGMPVTSES